VKVHGDDAQHLNATLLLVRFSLVVDITPVPLPLAL
jgi:hypothetical protein